ncbi:unnamed protein product [Rhizoctonia solani]|uniref:Uncharacterized protein n=1 Tax=Rhizoctonia solani TaxID=456999 RepID=A0A8H3A2Z3_9AGAM|nr:unnamed protein product [Rhizoctonia solani]
MLSHWRTSSSRLHFLAGCLLTVSPALSWAASCGKTHTVASGEGCWSIFTDAKLTQAQFLAMNAGLDCALLQVGQQVCTAVACSKFYTVQSGDYCYKIQTEQKVSDADMKTLNPGFTCEELFPGQNVCVSAPTTTVPTTTSAPATTAVPTTSVPVTTSTAVPVPSPTSIVQEGDWCAKIESAYNLASGGLVKLNPGLSCEALARGQDICVEPGVPGNSADNVVVPPIDRFPALAAGTTIPQSPILAFASAEGNARDTFYGEVIFQSDSQHLEAFAHNDLNGDGLLDQDELQKMMSFDPAALRGITEINSKLNADNLVPEMLKAADLNGDGKINKDEYLFAIRQIQNVTNVVTDLAADNTPAGLERKRIIPAMIAAVAVIIGLVVADVTLFFQILAKNELFRGNDLLSYLDIRYWDGKGNPPSCAAYMYWSSNCGAIGSGHAKSCSNGGERVFGSSCVTHFHKGSAGCGFLGCKSLCYNYNLDNCDCSALKYTIERDTEYTDSPWSTTNEVGVAACRSKCGGTTGCVGYSVSPGSSDTTLSCKVFKTMSNKKSNGKYTSFRLEGSPVGGQQCAPVEAGYTVWPTSVMEEDQKKGEMFSEAYRTTTSSLAKRAAPARVDRRDDAKFSTTIKRQTCGLCAPFSFTSTVEGSLKIKKGGYTDNDDLSPVWLGMCKGGQKCGSGGRHDWLRDKVGRSYIKREVCVPSTQTSNPKCDAACTGFLPYVSTYKKFDFVGLVDRGEIRKKVEDVKLWISETGPVMASMCTNTTAWQNYATSLKNTGPDTVFYDKDKQWGNSTCGKCDHAITIVGYFEFQRASKTSLAWIIHNSYGTTRERTYWEKEEKEEKNIPDAAAVETLMQQEVGPRHPIIPFTRPDQ